MELFAAHKQWVNRPADQRFPSIQALYDVTRQYADTAREKSVNYADIRTEAVDGNVQLVGRAGIPAQLTHWSFSQLATRIGAPASYLRKLPATLATQNLNHGLKQLKPDDTASLLFHSNGSLLLRAITSEKYSRIWNWEVAERLLEMQTRGWLPANECKSAIASWSQDGNVDTPLYASDHDMFAFVANPQAIVKEEGSTEPLFRGVIVENSEVGASALKMTRFLYRFMCGNHIIWGASKVVNLSLRHVGSIRDRFQSFAVELKRYAEESASDVEARIASSKRVLIADTKENVLDKLFGLRLLGLSQKVLEESFDSVNREQDGDPRSVWGFAQGITRYSQTLCHADKRTALDKAAGKLLEVDF